ncbi:hypothetical protein ACMGD3_23980 [Lysinibacillus sphaericus]|uniref:hypothetical protein n=1 Tax=Lysinibacillus sphaericus TaxID=1421 RepID=UPI003F7A6B9D
MLRVNKKFLLSIIFIFMAWTFLASIYLCYVGANMFISESTFPLAENINKEYTLVVMGLSLISCIVSINILGRYMQSRPGQ